MVCPLQGFGLALCSSGWYADSCADECTNQCADDYTNSHRVTVQTDATMDVLTNAPSDASTTAFLYFGPEAVFVSTWRPGVAGRANPLILNILVSILITPL